MSNCDFLVVGDEPDELFVESECSRMDASANILTEDFPDPVIPIILCVGKCQSSKRKRSNSHDDNICVLRWGGVTVRVRRRHLPVRCYGRSVDGRVDEGLPPRLGY